MTDTLRQLCLDHHAFEAVDHVPLDPNTTAFKRRARLQQALWRERREYPIGSQPMVPRAGEASRPLGSRLDLDFARRTGANFLDDRVRAAVTHRLAHPEPHQTLDENRLYGDLLSSMPMCFNLFGPLADDPPLADRAIRTWWPKPLGTVRAVRFEWSPARATPGRFLENRSAFDVAFELDLPDGTVGVVGIETKYHEHAKAESCPSPQRLERYRQVSAKSGAFREGAIEQIVGTDLQQIWLDHLLALSLLQDADGPWSWAKFVLVHPARNPSHAKACARYRDLLLEPDSFEVRTIESLLDANTLEPTHAEAFRARYLWEDNDFT